MRTTGGSAAPDPGSLQAALELAQAAVRAAQEAIDRASQPVPAPPPRWLRAEDVAARLGVSKRAVYHWFADGTLPVVRVGQAVRCPEDELEAWMARQQERRQPMAPSGMPTTEYRRWRR